MREWSAAINAGHDRAAAHLFAKNAEIVQPGRSGRLTSPRVALAWNESLPCSGTIVALSTAGDTVTATFVLGNRPGHACDGPGANASAVIRVTRGKIVLWHQTATLPAQPPAGQPV